MPNWASGGKKDEGTVGDGDRWRGEQECTQSRTSALRSDKVARKEFLCCPNERGCEQLRKGDDAGEEARRVGVEVTQTMVKPLGKTSSICTYVDD